MKRGLTGSPCVYGCVDAMAVQMMTTTCESIQFI
jgi:hypothetical protein